MFAPQRGSTLKKFQEIAEADFTIELQENYDSDVWARHQKVNELKVKDFVIICYRRVLICKNKLII